MPKALVLYFTKDFTDKNSIKRIIDYCKPYKRKTSHGGTKAQRRRR